VIRATQIYHIRLQYSRLQAPITTEQSTRHRLQPSRVQGTDYNRAEYKAQAPITTEQSTRHRLQIGASNCELGEAKSAPAELKYFGALHLLC